MINKKLHNKSSTLGRWCAFLCSILFLTGYGLYTMKVNLGKKEIQEVEGYIPISNEVLNEANNIAIQSGGRVKPLITWSKFLTYSLHGSSSLKIKHQEKTYKLSSTEIILQCLFRPNFTKQLNLFRIEDKTVLTSLSVETDNTSELLKNKKRRDRYSYQQLKPFLPQLINKSELIYEKESKTWSNIERQTVNLTDSVISYYNLSVHFDFARQQFPPLPNKSDSPALLSEWMNNFDIFLSSIQQLQKENGELTPEVLNIWSTFETAAGKSKDGLYIIPQKDITGNWKTFGGELILFFENEHQQPKRLIHDVTLIEDIVESFQTNDKNKIVSSLASWNEASAIKTSQTYTKKIISEVKYTERNYFFNALLLLFPALLLLLLSWVITNKKVNKAFNYMIISLVSISCIFVLSGITHRCLLMGRPPIGNLFDTIIFIAGLSLLILLVIEWMTKKSLAIGLAVFLGITLLFLARRYEIGDGKDHLDPLVAVLDSNFWLATHVVTITLGYMGGLVAAGISATYILGRVFGISHNESDFRKTLNQIAYGMLGFTLLFSLIGTVLGGIWANDSWGRFWGWDPKENGALMIVLWCLILLHARLAGFLKEWGIHICSVLGANVVVFSWWHVNSLSTGLHSYGFIEGINAIWGIYALTTLIALLGVCTKFMTRKKPTSLLPKPL